MIARRLPPTRMPASRLEHAIGLAQLAEYLWLTHRARLAADPHLTVTRFPDTHGMMVWEARTGHLTLHVDAQGTVYTYKPGEWEGHLGRLVLGPPTRPGHRTLTLDVPLPTLHAAAAWAEQHGPPSNPLEALGLLGLHTAQAPTTERPPCM